MLPVIPKPPITPAQKKAALVVAGVIDLLQMGVFPAVIPGAISPVQTGFDILAAILLLAICGFKWQFALAFLIELFPFVGIFPTWSAVVLMLPSEEPRVNVHPMAAPPVATVATKRDVIHVDAVVVPPVRESKPASGKPS
jgi:hypothetical protein